MFDDIFAKLKDAAMFLKEIVDEGDGSIQKVFDKERFQQGMQNMGAVGMEMSKPIAPPEMLARGQMMPIPEMQTPQVNPYAPVQMPMQQPTGGIGSVPTLEQILMALQSRGQ